MRPQRQGGWGRRGGAHTILGAELTLNLPDAYLDLRCLMRLFIYASVLGPCLSIYATLYLCVCLGTLIIKICLGTLIFSVLVCIIAHIIYVYHLACKKPGGYDHPA